MTEHVAQLEAEIQQLNEEKNRRDSEKLELENSKKKDRRPRKEFCCKREGTRAVESEAEEGVQTLVRGTAV